MRKILIPIVFICVLFFDTKAQNPDYYKILRMDTVDCSANECMLDFLDLLATRYWTAIGLEGKPGRRAIWLENFKCDFTFDFVIAESNTFPEGTKRFTPKEAEEFFMGEYFRGKK